MRRYTTPEYFSVLLKSVTHSHSFRANQYRDPESIKQLQYHRIKKLIEHAYKTTKLYRKKYDEAKVSPKDFTKLDDITKFPTVTKDEIIDAYPYLEEEDIAEALRFETSE